jgi:predicted secreted Zn-dependent protease
MKKKKHNDQDLERIYNDIFSDAIQYMREYEAQAVAATYMAIAMRLYKTHLDEDSYRNMIKTVMESEVRPYDPDFVDYDKHLKKILH